MAFTAIPFSWRNDLLSETNLRSYKFNDTYLNTIHMDIQQYRGSILAALLFYTMFNLSHALYPVLDTDLGSLSFILLELAIAIVVILIWGYKLLSKQNLILTRMKIFNFFFILNKNLKDFKKII